MIDEVERSVNKKLDAIMEKLSAPAAAPSPAAAAATKKRKRSAADSPGDATENEEEEVDELQEQEDELDSIGHDCLVAASRQAVQSVTLF